jgi:hypothetical protein
MKDTRLIERALHERWPIPQTLRRPLVERLGKIIQDPDASPREVVSAARAVLAASRINLEALSVVAKVREGEEIIARIDELEKKVDEQDQGAFGGYRSPDWNGRP